MFAYILVAIVIICAFIAIIKGIKKHKKENVNYVISILPEKSDRELNKMHEFIVNQRVFKNIFNSKGVEHELKYEEYYCFNENDFNKLDEAVSKEINRRGI